MPDRVPGIRSGIAVASPQHSYSVTTVSYIVVSTGSPIRPDDLPAGAGRRSELVRSSRTIADWRPSDPRGWSLLQQETLARTDRSVVVDPSTSWPEGWGLPMIVIEYRCVRCGATWSSSGVRARSRYCRQCRKGLIEGDRTLVRAELEARLAALEPRLADMKSAVAACEDAVNSRERASVGWVHSVLLALHVVNPVVAVDERRALEVAKLRYVQQRRRIATIKHLLSEHIPEAQARFRTKVRATSAQKRAAARAFSRTRTGQLSVTAVARDGYLLSEGDYRRGNPVDNYVRREWSSSIIGHFGGTCVVCGASRTLCLDHWWRAKNAGGNLVMLDAEELVVRGNVLLLCSSCNSAKRDRAVDHFLTPEASAKLTELEGELTKAMRSDRRLCRILSRWYRVVVAPSEPCHPLVPLVRTVM